MDSGEPCFAHFEGDTAQPVCGLAPTTGGMSPYRESLCLEFNGYAKA